MTVQTKPTGKILRGLFTALGIAALVLGVLSTTWLVALTKQWLLPWSSLSVLAPPKPPPAAPTDRGPL